MWGERRSSFVLMAVLIACAASASAQSSQDLDRACAAVGRLNLPQTHITKTDAIHPSGEYGVPGTDKGTVSGDRWYQGKGGPLVRVHRAFCRVAGVIDPAIHFETWLPLEGWNGRFEGLGLGAFWGALPYAGMARALDAGYAVGGTDSGHQSEFDDARWTLKDGALNSGVVGDWGYRSMHEMTVKSQAIVEAVYGRRAHHSYFAGCSSGGYQALTEAQRFPTDYDGILAGAPANYLTHLQAAQLAFGLATRVDPATNLEMPFDKLPMIHRAVLRACDAADGVTDGLIENPAACRFDPAVLTCKGGDASDCLTPPQVQALKRIYGDVRTSDGRKIFPGLPMGSELEWKLMSSMQVGFAQTFYRYFVFQNPEWNYATMNIDRDVAFADEHIGKQLNSINADLRPFRDHGGKLIQYHGWADWGITPYSSIDYFNTVVATVGGSMSDAARRDVQQFHRLFMLPGVSHCSGGAGPDQFAGLTALEQWVEQGKAPERIEAAKVVDGKTVRTRPLCPYPQAARYQGTGSTDEAANFKCQLP